MKIELCVFVVSESCATVTVELIVVIVREIAVGTLGCLVNVVTVVDVTTEVFRNVLQEQRVND